MNQGVLDRFTIPEELKSTLEKADAKELTVWENRLLSFFSDHYKMFTAYPKYFQLRTYEFRVLRQLAPEYFDVSRPYESALEIGCNFGYKSILLSPYTKRLLAVDIPTSYDGCRRGTFERTTDIAKILVNEKFNISHVTFENMWPHELAIESDSVDFIFTEYVLEHIPELSPAIGEMHRVLKKGGVMIHTVPNTLDGMRVILDANLNITWRGLWRIVKSQIGGWIKRQNRRQAVLRCNGTIVPPCHSDHIDDFSRQLDIYTLENYLTPMLEFGFVIEKVLSTRENNHVIIAKKVS